ncbi:MAG: hypothetical protein ACFNVI_09845 [Lachnoanaerobaculum gingivalis]
MEFDESLQQYIYSYEDLIFAWDEEPEGEYINVVKVLSKNYKDNFDKIIDFMMPDLREMYGDISREDVKNNLGKPIIDYNQGTVSYCEQIFDDWHIFEFEFSDEKFEKLEHFSVNG